MCMCAQVLQSFPTFCDPVNYRPPGSSLFMGFSRQEYWSGLPCPPPGDPPSWDQNQVSCISCTAGSFFTAELPRSLYIIIVYKFWYYINLAYTRPCLITSVKITSPTLNKYILNKIKVSFSWKSAILTVMWSEFQKISKNTHSYSVCTHMKGER